MSQTQEKQCIGVHFLYSVSSSLVKNSCKFNKNYCVKNWCATTTSRSRLPFLAFAQCGARRDCPKCAQTDEIVSLFCAEAFGRFRWASGKCSGAFAVSIPSLMQEKQIWRLLSTFSWFFKRFSQLEVSRIQEWRWAVMRNRVNFLCRRVR